MSARQGRKAAALEARLAQEAEARGAVAARRRVRALGGILAAVIVVVVATVAISSAGGRANAVPSYLRHLLDAVPGLNVPAALGVSAASSAAAALTRANTVATQDGVNATPSFLIGKPGGPLRQFQPPTLTSAPFAAAFNALLGGSR